MLMKFIILLCAAALIALRIALKYALEAPHITKGEHCFSAQEADGAFDIADEQKGITNSLENAVVELIRLLR
jgi:hypothetical protein